MEEIDLKELFQIFWNKKLQIIMVVVIFVIIGVIYSFAYVTPVYTSSTTLVLTKVNTEDTQKTNQSTESITTSDILLNSQLVSTYSELVKSKKILRRVISNLKISIDEEDLRKNITVNSVKDTEFIQIDVTNQDAAIAAKIANEIAKVFTENVSEIYSINNVHIVDEAEPSSDPSNINHLKDIVIFGFIGVVVASMYVLIFNLFDTTISSIESIEKITKSTVLVTIPLHDFSQNSKNNNNQKDTQRKEKKK